jgi:hypothetical protein
MYDPAYAHIDLHLDAATGRLIIRQWWCTGATTTIATADRGQAEELLHRMAGALGFEARRQDAGDPPTG